MPLIFDPESKNRIKQVLSWLKNSIGILNSPQIKNRQSRLQAYLTNLIMSPQFKDLLQKNGFSEDEEFPKVRILNYCFENIHPNNFEANQFFPGYYSSGDHKIYLCLNYIDSEEILKENFIRELLLSKNCIIFTHFEFICNRNSGKYTIETL